MGDEMDTRGRTPVNPNMFTGPRTLILGITGQSKLSNTSSASAYAPWTGKVFEFNPFDNKIYPSDGGPVLGCTAPTGPYVGRINVMPYILDLAGANNQFNQVLMANATSNGTSAEEWCAIVATAIRGHPHVLAALTSLGIPPNCWIQRSGRR